MNFTCTMSGVLYDSRNKQQLLSYEYSLIIPNGSTLYCLQSTKIIFVYNTDKSIPVTVRSKAWVCGHSLADNAGSNPTGGMDSESCECCLLEEDVFLLF